MPTMENFEYEFPYSMFKGEPGTRKSTQALSFPTPQYWFDTDKKMDALLLPMKNWGINRADIHYDYYTSLAAEKNWNAIIKKLQSFRKSCPFKTIICDSITSEADLINRQTIGSKEGETNKAGQERGLKIGGIAVNDMQDYKAEAAAFVEAMELLKDINEYHKVNIILIAHVVGTRSEADRKQGSHFARIIVTGGKIISAKIPAYCSEIYHFGVDNSTMEAGFEVLTQHNGDDFARTSLPLEKKVAFTNQKLYDTVIKPAIDKLKLKK